MSDRATTKILMDRLERHYIKPGPMPGGVFVPECGLNGPSSQRRCDALYVGFTSSSGRLLIGHEVKASRADWRKELDTAGKADLWADNCHEWWIVAPGPEVVPKEEIPHGWGLMYPSSRTKTRMEKVVAPVRHVDRDPDWLVMRSIIARLDTLRQQHDLDVIRKAQEAAREEHTRLRQLDADRDARQALTDEQRDQINALERIQKALGVDSITDWRWGDEGGLDDIDARTAAAALRLVDLVARGGLESHRFAHDSLRQTVQNMGALLDDFEAARSALAALGGKDDR